ncbi:potassium-transporting ATPase subunit KdpC [Providencia sp. PROV188]|jgi:K+-transporting ATPase ATPase C chain|uniref:potassium-transporting ATPase subunit KdpC n=1 Tax=Providencia TaxID=586 RepID=UPI0003E1EAD9|nr:MULTISPECIES: potassium-transporting ATPase subunit KdpC [Providencia]ETT03456.1 K+-transporting ATPase, C subunit [Providencia alcalifaciens PAL-3]EUC99476.1 K+-transporting ATPase, C subunit [Providencia alcalifaciens PAL-1]MBC5789655.1 potassium-transporting ATPase subunit KdpC [Providencia sp. JUb39]MBG5884696.1 potassium-transporting ATPase subunit KdpC [Providencia alcalifaciens]MDR2241265.1 potassium-transporting ATPase subunit KdpC [Providencia alcalifaciens]
MSMFRSSLMILVLLTLVTGIAYPLLVTGLANVIFPTQSMGSLILQDNRIIGSSLIGQSYQNDNYFYGRPSVTAEMPYNALASGGSNLAISNPLLTKELTERSVALKQHEPDGGDILPVDLLTASSSGLDPHISVAAALYQAPRIAKNRQLSIDKVKSLISDNTQSPLFRFLGEPVVNVLELNLALDTYQREANSQNL